LRTPSEIIIGKKWLEDPKTAKQKKYVQAESVYRKFVYDHYLTVDKELNEDLKKIFW